MYVLYLFVFLSNVLFCSCQSSTMVVNVVEIASTSSFTFVCNVPSSTNLTRWTYLTGSTGTSLMSYRNGRCTVSPFDSFLSNRTLYSYTCNSTVYQASIFLYTTNSNINNHILACRDAVQVDGTGFNWFIKIVSGSSCSYCEPTMLFGVQEITEGDSVTFICKVSSGVTYVNWVKNMGSNTAAMSGQNGQCSTQGTTFLDDTIKNFYTCNSTVYQVTILNIQRSEHNDVYMCTAANQKEGSGSNWIIRVKAPVSSVAMTPTNYLVSVKENTAVEFTCHTSTARPAASVYWIRHSYGTYTDYARITDNITTTTDYNDLSVTTSILRFFPTRQDNNTYIYCRANNSINTSHVKPSRKSLLNVLYKAEYPYIIQGNDYRVIETTPGTLSCTVKGGNPTPTLSWNCNHFSTTSQSTILNSNGNITTTLTWTLSRTHEGKCTCTSQQTGFQDFSTDASLIVLYPPSKPTFKLYGSNVKGDISFIEGTSVRINCTADSNPSPGRYTWTGPRILDSINIQSFSLRNIEKVDAGEYKCNVHNTMNPTSGGPVAGINTSTVNVLVLYPPVVFPVNDMSKQNGTRLNVVCNFTAGMPETTSVKWTREIDNRILNTATLNIESLEKSDIGIYTCTASNTMQQSGDNKSYIGQHNQSFYLDVHYAATITSFTIDGFTSQTVTVNESDSVRFICTADSNPTAVMTLIHKSKTLKNVTSNSIKNNIADARCLDAGTYFCSAQNMYNDENEVQNTAQLFVNCYPRAGEDIDVNITGERKSTVTIVFNVIAHPSPNFTWYQLVDGNWTRLHTGDEHIIESKNLQSNLTIHSVGIDDFTSYKVVVENEFGQMEQIYTLSPYDKPDPPTSLRHIEILKTTSSIHIEWQPGFDNGPSQTFYIKYKKSSDTEWNYLSVSDNGESTMNITLTGLLENTQYDVIIFASNVKGNSSESDVLVTRTTAIQPQPKTPGALIGGITGGVAGCIIIIVVIIFIIRKYSLFKDCYKSGPRRKSDETNHSAEEHAYYNVGSGTIETKSLADETAYYNVSSVPEYETINQNNVETTTYSTLDQTDLCTTSDDFNKEKTTVYENLKLEVF